MVATQVAAGRLVRLREGVLLAASAWPEDRVRRHVLLARSEQVANPAAVISHGSAALVWDLPAPPFADWTELPPTLTLPRGGGWRNRRSATARLVVRTLPPHHITLDPQGWAVTTLARTAVDLAVGQDLPAALVVLDASARLACAEVVLRPRRSDYANPALLASIRAGLRDACAGRNGMSPTLTAIDLTDPRRESPIESLTAGHLHLAGLPMPEFQAPIQTPMGTLYPDCLWREERVVGEADGAGKYQDGDAFVREKEREQVLRDLDFRVVRWLGKEITRRPGVVMQRIARELERAA